LFEAITLIQTKKITKRPIVLIGSDYWTGLVKWVKEIMLEKEHNISAEDMNYLNIVDTADEAVKYIEDFYKTHELSPNF
jgi:predicted Rossmann-fold nucleotide-binding protein